MKEYTVTFHFKSNLHIGSGFSFMGLVDKTTIKDSKKTVIIPGSTIKGKLRSVCKKICLSLESEFGEVCAGKDHPEICKMPLDKVCIICHLFGSPYTEGKLVFKDVSLSPDEREEVLQGRGRNAGHPAPPAQIRTCGTTAYGSYLKYLASKRTL